MTKQFKMIQEKNVNTLEELVSQHLNDGWTLAGQILPLPAQTPMGTAVVFFVPMVHYGE
jgi:hypothetical protein